ncbi:MAG: DUF5615 family PIN-like protein [Pirellulales bacterium]
MDFLLDENTDPAVGTVLRRERQGIKVWYVGEVAAPSLGTLDPEILIWCELHDCGLVTRNRSTMPVHLKSHLEQGRHVPGIFVLGHELSLGDLVSDLTLIWDVAKPGEFADQIVYLPI